jgi:hypothetical protein
MKAKYIFSGLLALTLASSCSDNMDYNETNIRDRDYITQTFEKVGGFMTDIYNHLDYDFGQHYGGAMLASATDESVFSKAGGSIETFYNGSWSPSNAQGSMWSSMYDGIRTCNEVLKNMQGLTFDDYKNNSDYPQQMFRYQNYKWEARFCRAYFYFNLVRQYGGVPIIDMDMSAEEVNNQPRKSSDEVFEYIISECDAIKDSIVKDYSDLGSNTLGAPDDGRVNNLTVMALKARAALYWASPLFNAGGDKERYHQAALYTKALLDSCEQRGMHLDKNYADLWSTKNYSDEDKKSEIIFGRRIYGTAGGSGEDNTLEKYNYPIGIEGGSSASNCPSQNLVDAYEMQKSGKGISETGSGYDAANPFDGRDPRLALTIAKNGDKWPTASAYKSVLQTYEGGINGEPLVGATPTGYYLRKLCHGDIDLRAKSKKKGDFHTWVTFRMGEFYLNYAEAVFKYLGSATATAADLPMSANAAIDKVRERAGMPDFPADLDAASFWKKYTNERFVELAFEGHRFWDVRRWKEAPQHFTNIRESKITKNDDGTFTYKVETVTRQWDDKYYLFPIPVSVMLKHQQYGKAWEQNPGWE